MLNRSEFKISFTVVIFVVFVFKLLCVNISLFSSTPQSSSVLAKYVSYTQKKKQYAKVTIQSSIVDYTTGDVCEEDSDNEENLKKACSTAVLPTPYSFHKHTASTSKSNHPFDLKSNSYPKKYLAISSLKI